ncbi:GNAT family N-acetyltransferase [Larkinella bovis]|uniref:GNAT family N-acetyltransferase n=1 Tax=Larkinella bovis TaxID=683041 RepID=A0ABW0I8B9_9BACT
MKILSLSALTQEQYLAAQALEISCKTADGLQGFIHWDKTMNFYPSMRHWFLLYDQHVLIAVLSAFAPTTTQIEFGGYTLPKARRKGCFSLLLDVAKEEARKYNYQHLLLITEQASFAGQAFVQRLGATHAHTEYQLLWQPSPSAKPPVSSEAVRLVEATLADLESLTEVSHSIFGGTPQEARQILETSITSPHLTQYVAVRQEKPVGIVAVNFVQDDAWIIGLGVCPEWQGNGLGKAILLQTLALLQRDARAKAIRIEVDSGNEAALKLYLKSGFTVQMGQDYFRLPLA